MHPSECSQCCMSSPNFGQGAWNRVFMCVPACPVLTLDREHGTRFLCVSLSDHTENTNLAEKMSSQHFHVTLFLHSDSL